MRSALDQEDDGETRGECAEGYYGDSLVHHAAADRDITVDEAFTLAGIE